VDLSFKTKNRTELAVRLLRVEPQRRQRLEAELRAGQAPTGGLGAGYSARREAVGEWLWAELFRDPGERGRRLRCVDACTQIRRPTVW
jgi:hypothetical protein